MRKVLAILIATSVICSNLFVVNAADINEEQSSENTQQYVVTEPVTENNEVELDIEEDEIITEKSLDTVSETFTKNDLNSSNENITFLGGDGSVENPYQISTAEQMDSIRYDMKASYVLVNDIDMSEIDWLPVGTDDNRFYGNFDGREHVLNNVTIENTEVDHIGLFGCIENKSIIKNINIENLEILVDKIDTDYNIKDFHGLWVGGISGISYSIIENCNVKGNIKVINCYEATIGGITGAGNAKNCINYCDILSEGIYSHRGEIVCGGINGYSPSDRNLVTVKCKNYGNINCISGRGVKIGGINGEGGIVSKCVNYGNVTGSHKESSEWDYSKTEYIYIGGINGQSSGEIKECFNYGNVSGFGRNGGLSHAGGITGFVGSDDRSIISCYNMSKNIDSKSELKYYNKDTIEIVDDEAYRIVGWSFPNKVFSCYSISKTLLNGKYPIEEIGSDLHNGKDLEEEEIERMADVFLNGTFFSVEESGWCFGNSYEGFALKEDYQIPVSIYEKVYGKAVAENVNLVKWGGNCFGMSLSSILLACNQIKWYDINTSIKKTNDYYTGITSSYASCKSNDYVFELIESYQILTESEWFKNKFSTKMEKELNENYRQKTNDEIIVKSPLSIIFELIIHSNKHNPNGTYISDILNKIKNSNEPLVLGVVGKNYGHAVVTRTDKKIQETDNGWYRVYIYNPNNPYLSNNVGIDESKLELNHYNYLKQNGDDTYIELNPNKNQFRFYSSVTANSKSQLLGTDKNGKVKYMFNNDNQQLYPEFIYLLDSNVLKEIPSVDSGDAPYFSDNSIGINCQNCQNIIINDNSGNFVAGIINGSGYSEKDINLVYNTGSFINNQMSNVQSIILPEGQYKIYTDKEEDLSLSFNSNITNITSSKELELEIDSLTQEISARGKSDGEIKMSLANISAPSSYCRVDLAAETTGENTLSIKYDQNNNLKLDASDKNQKADIKVSNELGEKSYDNINVSNVDDVNIEDVIEGKSDIVNKDEVPKYNVTFINGKNVIQKQIIAEGDYVISCPIDSNGFKFSGWYTERDCINKWNFNIPVSSDLMLYAKWEPIKYSVNYNLYGETGAVNPTAYTIETETFSLKSPSRKGYSFAGWYSDSFYREKVDMISKGTTGNKTLYAKWLPIAYGITYNLNKGKNSNSNPGSFNIETNIELKNPVRKGYMFSGWYSDSNYKNKVVKIPQGSIGNKTLFAKWSKVSVKKVSLSKIQSVKNKQLKVIFKRLSGVKGYQVQYSTSKKFTKKYTKSVAVKQSSKKTLSKIIKKLKKNKTYHVRVRAYKVDSCKNNVYGKWSKVKKIKIIH